MKGQKPLHLYKAEELKTPKHLDKEYMVFEKYDGWYGYFEDGHIYSFANRIVPSVQWLADEIGLVFDKTEHIAGRLVFEILLTNEDDFHTLNGILNRKRESAVDAYVRVHDWIPYRDNALRPLTNAERYSKACDIVTRLNHDRVLIAPVLAITPAVWLWRELCEEIWSQGGEGIIMKQSAAEYKWGGRDTTLLKIKCECTFEAVVVGVVAGKRGGKYAASLGALQVQTKDGTVHTVSGMSDNERLLWWSNHDFIMGQVVECQAMSKLPDGSYREPRFKAVRHDKMKEDID